MWVAIDSFSALWKCPIAMCSRIVKGLVACTLRLLTIEWQSLRCNHGFSWPVVRREVDTFGEDLLWKAPIWQLSSDTTWFLNKESVRMRWLASPLLPALFRIHLGQLAFHTSICMESRFWQNGVKIVCGAHLIGFDRNTYDTFAKAQSWMHFRI